MTPSRRRWTLLLGALTLFTASLWLLATTLQAVEVEVTNGMTDRALTDVILRLRTFRADAAPVRVARIEPGGRATLAQVPHGEASAELSYSVAGERYTSAAPELEYVDAGYRVGVRIEAPGRAVVRRFQLGLTTPRSLTAIALGCAALLAALLEGLLTIQELARRAPRPHPNPR